jgi:SHS2 domain-containing protein
MARAAVQPLDHTGDVGFTLRARDLSALFEVAGTALVAELMASPPRDPDPTSEAGAEGDTELDLRADSLDRLLLRWLDELVYLVQTRGRVPVRATPRVTPPAQPHGVWRLEARVRTARFDPDAHAWRTEVKGVTYHGLEVRRTARGWRARVILDV